MQENTDRVAARPWTASLTDTDETVWYDRRVTGNWYLLSDT